MRTLRKAFSVSVLLFAFATSPALAQSSMGSAIEVSAEQADLADDAEATALAQQIIDIGMPEETREDVFFKAMDDLMVQMRVAIEPKLPKDDPEVIKILDTWLLEFLDDSKSRLRSHIPALIDGMVQGYVNLYSNEELRDILAFVKTPSGQKFFQTSSEIIGQPEFAAANQVYMAEAMEAVEPAREELVKRLTDYFEQEEAALDGANAS